jgi:hypothetical protein
MKRILVALLTAAVLTVLFVEVSARADDYVQQALDQSMLQAQWQREQDAALQQQLLLDQQSQFQMQQDMLQNQLAQDQFNLAQDQFNQTQMMLAQQAAQP